MRNSKAIRGISVSAVGIAAMAMTACGTSNTAHSSSNASQSSGSQNSTAGNTTSSNTSNSSSASNSSNQTQTTSASSGKKFTFRLADDQPANYPTVVGDKAFAQEVNQKTNGRITIKIYPNAQLGAENSVAQQVQLGAVDFARINAAALSSYDKELNVLQLPYLFNSTKQKWDVLNGKPGTELLQSLSSAKMVGLTYYDSGTRNFYNTKHPVSKPSDLKGLKIRVQQSNLMVGLVNTLGASATPMAYGEVYNALQSGVIDGAENNIPSYYTTNHYKAAKYLTMDHHTATPEILLASQKTWSKLSPADQKIIQQAALDSQKVERQSWNALVQKALKAIKANGNVITQVNTSVWQAAVKPIYKKYGSQYQSIITEIRNTK